MCFYHKLKFIFYKNDVFLLKIFIHNEYQIVGICNVKFMSYRGDALLVTIYNNEYKIIG